MKKFIIIIIIFVGLIALIAYISRPFDSSSTSNISELSDEDTLQLSYKDSMINLEVAKSFEKRQKGLMLREALAENSGMIFIFEDENVRSFWMKDTLISLDMIFVDKNLKVISIHQNTKPNQTSEIYSSNYPVHYGIELRAGWATKNNLQVGESFSREN